MKNFYSKLCLFLAMVLTVQYSWGQGNTTAALNGVVQDETGMALPGATVIAVHQPTNTQYVTPTNTEGRYNLQNLRAGGPYIVTVKYVGYEDKITDNLNLQLGQNLTLNFDLTSSSQTLSEVEIVDKKDDLINIDRTGAATNIREEQIETLPTISRGLEDFTRLTPQASTAGNGTSFAGQNNRYNNFSIDGTVNNDVFGLSSSGTNGGQTGIQPISLDAIEQVQVVIAPFDVRQGGFTGGGVNAITRSGSNNFEGSLYYFGNNEALVGKSPDEARTKLDEYTDYQTGFRLGGPIIKNKLFFFANGEVTSKTSPLLYEPGTPASNISLAEVDSVIDVLDRFGYDPGAFGAISDETNSQKLFARLDWNISNNHQLTLRHSYVYGENIDNTRSPNSLRFYNNGEFFPTTTNSSVLQLLSSFGGQFSNDLLIGYTSVRDDRDPLGAPFPAVDIRLSGNRTISVGGEPFSVANQLDQDVLTVTDNFSWFRGNHTLTFGTHNEFYKTYNLFIRQNYGAYTYNSLEDFYTLGTEEEALPREYNYSYSLTDNPLQGGEFSAFQLGFYAQDEYAVTPNLKVTGGVRFDIPVFNDRPAANADFNETYANRNLATDKLQDAQVMISPRIGFNWDATGDQSTQIRGGAGIFTGRVPFVWLSNQYTNTGTDFARVRARSRDFPEDFAFQPDPFNQPDAADLGLNAFTSEINVTDQDFKFPQVFRTNLAVDQRLPGGVIGTLELIYSKTLNNIDYKNLNVQAQTDGSGNVITLDGADNRPIYETGINDNYTDILVLTNTSKGYSYNATAQLQKNFENGLYASVAYTYGRSKDINGGTSSQAISNWRFIENVNGPNDVELGYADFDIASRVVAAAGYALNYENGSTTTISAFYNGQSGVGMSYIYDGDVNNDGQFSNDLIYIPRDASEITFVGTPGEQNAQWVAFNNYIEADDYLSERRGQYAERNGYRLPWQNQVDVRLMHELKLDVVGEQDHKLQFSFDVFNIGNLINKDWGRQYDVTNQSFQLLTFEDYEEGTNLPTFSYTGEGLNDGEPYFVSGFFSRWRAQVGVRYIFE